MNEERKVHYLNGRRYVEDPQSREWREMVDIPPHGRLVDADALTREQGFRDYKYVNGLVYVSVCEVVGLINAAPTIIPADKEREA